MLAIRIVSYCLPECKIAWGSKKLTTIENHENILRVRSCLNDTAGRAGGVPSGTEKRQYASRRGLTIGNWFEEQESAAKRGRPVFTKLVGLLKSKKAAGIIIHKIDRGARNLRDWADMADLMDLGIEVHFAHESFDLQSRSGRLSADILAVVAADYIRNLREETMKGISGRLRQGLFPFSAPVGYVNNGGGKVKTVDPVSGPLVKQVFELYATREYSLHSLEEEMFKRGLRSRTGKIVYLSQLATVLRNPFYMGLIRLKNHKDTYAGIHLPIISSSLFNEVQLIIDGKRSQLRQPNFFLFRLFLRCEHCNLFLVGERQKGHVYYRCHRRLCPRTCVREEQFETAVIAELKKLTISPDEESVVNEVLADFKHRNTEVMQKVRRDTENEIAQVRESIRVLLQKFLDNDITKATFDEGHAPLLMQRKASEEKLHGLAKEVGIYERIDELVNYLKILLHTFSAGGPIEMRKLVERVFSAITTNGSSMIHIATKPLMAEIAGRERTKNGWNRLLPNIIKELAV